MTFNKQITAFIRDHKEDERMAPFVNPVKEASKLLTDITMNHLMAKAAKDPEEGGAVASNYLNVFALTTIGYLLGRQAKVALDQEGKFYRTKLKTIRFYMDNILPEIHSLVAIIRSGKANMMAFETDEF